MSAQPVDLLPAPLMSLLIPVKANVLQIYENINDMKWNVQILIGEIFRAKKDIENANDILSNLTPLGNGYTMLEVKMGIFSQVTKEKIEKIIDIEKDSKLCIADALDESHACLTRLFNQLKVIASEHAHLVEIIKSGQQEMERIKHVETHANNTASDYDEFLHISDEHVPPHESLLADDAPLCAASKKHGTGTCIKQAAMSLISRKFMSSFLKRLETIYSNDITATFDRCVAFYEHVIRISTDTQVIFDKTQDTVQKLINELVEKMIIEKNC